MTAKQLESVHLDGVQIKIIRSSRRKTLSLEVSHAGIMARAPARMRLAIIEQFVASKSAWIAKSLQHLPTPQQPLELVNGCVLNVLGKPHELKIGSGRKPVHFNCNSHLVVPVCSRSQSESLALRSKLIKWYKKLASQHLELKVKHYAESMSLEGINPKIKVREYKRRWGSCDHRGNLSFNWRIIMAPESVLNYVVIHELAHLQEFNHSKRFWRIVADEMPGWKQKQDWLAANGCHLYRI
jgi:predicted metal-dependent hydrolase